jgi:hypothetical protein
MIPDGSSVTVRADERTWVMSTASAARLGIRADVRLDISPAVVEEMIMWARGGWRDVAGVSDKYRLLHWLVEFGVRIGPVDVVKWHSNCFHSDKFVTFSESQLVKKYLANEVGPRTGYICDRCYDSMLKSVRLVDQLDTSA